MVKSVDGKLNAVEETHKGLGRPIHWWEKQFKFSDSQNIMKADFMTYNENSMSDKKTTLAKSLWEADMLVDLAECLSDYIYWRAWEGEDAADLKTALESIKQAAIAELQEPENFPEVVSVAIENACRALNISKKEELATMIKDRKDAKKSVVGQEDRDEEANVVVTAEENGKPADPDAPVVDADAEGAEDSEEEVTEPDANDDDSAEEDAEDEDSDDDGAEDADDAAADDKDKDGKGGKGKKSAPAPMKKSTGDSDDLAKSILSGVEKLIAKAVDPLKEEIETLKKQPAASKVKSTFTVKKGEDVDGSPSEDDSAEGKLKAEFDQLNKRADELALDPNVGTPEERMQVGFKLRKLSRQLDPASVAQNAAVRATFNRGQ